ncbi:putative GIY-YIG superfamily endonuclease [Flavobacterium sp. 2755]|uniref:hypothetical protein n=1 Tax=Flavobacterium sp. 2755 TaxID=2817765 RepID=UPI002859C675|nr:hypothetical protein [Flavobacterium sp. 2755]MDR6763805.1 putative GIY-YIG superfamily endonuclease [Flavobacterium sp. 2755]
MELEKNLSNIITKKQAYKTSFLEITSQFERKFEEFNPVQNCFEIEKYFGGKCGISKVTNKLIQDGIIKKNWLRQYKTKGGKIKTDFKGLYIYIHQNTPIYVGISKGVIGRTLQHLKGHSHNTSTLAFNIGLIRYEIEKGEKYIGKRKQFDFKLDVTPAKEFLLKQRIAFIPIENDEEMYLFEIYCAMKLQCYLNKFETH